MISRPHAGIGRHASPGLNDKLSRYGRGYLCLDTLSTNARLRRYYEELGFCPVGAVSGPVDHPHTDAHGHWEAVLYEKQL